MESSSSTFGFKLQSIGSFLDEGVAELWFVSPLDWIRPLKRVMGAARLALLASLEFALLASLGFAVCSNGRGAQRRLAELFCRRGLFASG